MLCIRMDSEMVEWLLARKAHKTKIIKRNLYGTLFQFHQKFTQLADLCVSSCRHIRIHPKERHRFQSRFYPRIKYEPRASHFTVNCILNYVLSSCATPEFRTTPLTSARHLSGMIFRNVFGKTIHTSKALSTPFYDPPCRRYGINLPYDQNGWYFRTIFPNKWP